jgi:hypothetical protein
VATPPVEPIVTIPTRPVAVPEPVESAPLPEAPASPVTLAPQPRQAEPHVERPWWEPIPPEDDEAEEEQTKASQLDRQVQEDAAALRGTPEEEPEAPTQKPADRARLPEDDEFLSDVDDTVGDNEFKW